jgi:hypothetical protein
MTTVDQVTPELTRLRFLFVNPYLFCSSASWVLIDAGVQGSAGRIVDTATDRFGEGARPQAIFSRTATSITFGAFPELFEHWDVPVYAHRLELPHLNGQADYPPPDPTVGQGAIALMSFAFPNKAIDLGARVRSAPDDGSVPHILGWRWLHTPGHTVGRLSLSPRRPRAGSRVDQHSLRPSV